MAFLLLLLQQVTQYAYQGQAPGIVYCTLATHLDRKAASAGRRLLPGGRAPPPVSRFD